MGNGAVAFHHMFRSRNYVNSFGRNSANTWYELPDNIRHSLRYRVETRDGLICSKRYGHGCGQRFTSSELTIDHIIPIRAGGPVTDSNNMQLLCVKCHNKKTMEIDIAYSSSFRWRINHVSRPTTSNGTGRKRRHELHVKRV